MVAIYLGYLLNNENENKYSNWSKVQFYIFFFGFEKMKEVSSVSAESKDSSPGRQRCKPFCRAVRGVNNPVNCRESRSRSVRQSEHRSEWAERGVRMEKRMRAAANWGQNSNLVSDFTF